MVKTARVHITRRRPRPKRKSEKPPIYYKISPRLTTLIYIDVNKLGKLIRVVNEAVSKFTDLERRAKYIEKHAGVRASTNMFADAYPLVLVGQKA